MTSGLRETNRLQRKGGTAYRPKTSMLSHDRISFCGLGRSANSAGNSSQQTNSTHTTNKLNKTRAVTPSKTCNSSARTVTVQPRALGSAGRCDGKPVAQKGARRVRRRGRTLLWQQSMLPPLSYEGGGSGILPPHPTFLLRGFGGSFLSRKKSAPTEV